MRKPLPRRAIAPAWRESRSVSRELQTSLQFSGSSISRAGWCGPSPAFLAGDAMRELAARHLADGLDDARLNGETAMSIASANGVDLAYDEVGDPKAPTILLIMGLGTQMIAWPD